jgi:hypothetical protein
MNDTANTQPLITDDLHAVWAATATETSNGGVEAYAVGLMSTIVHRQSPGIWAAQKASATGDNFTCIGGANTSFIVTADIAGGSEVTFNQGMNWSGGPDPGFLVLNALWAGGGKAWLVGASTYNNTGAIRTLMLGTTTSFTPVSFAPPQPLLGVTGVPSGGNLFAVGVGGTVAHGLDINWTLDPAPTQSDLTAVSANDARVVAVGATGTILYANSNSVPPVWTGAVNRPAVTGSLYGVWASDTDYFAVGANGVILHSSDGQNWTKQDSGTTVTLYAVYGANGQVFAVGAGGTILVSSY